MDTKNKFMREAIMLSLKSLDNGGGPFGAVIVKENKIVGRGNNKVTQTNDPTAHAEIVAIRDACHNLNTFRLDDCDIYSSCEPCPMCLSAIYWAHIDQIYFANDKFDAKNIGFDDAFIYEELKKKNEDRKIPIVQLLRNEAMVGFDRWGELKEKTEY